MSDLISTIIKGKEIPRSEVLEWERRRALAVLKKLGAASAGKDLAGLHERLLDQKARIGDEGLFRLLRRELQVSRMAAEVASRLSFGARQACVTEMLVKQGRAEEFVEWFDSVTRGEDPKFRLGATPDHYRLRTGADGIMEVVETTGGAPLATHIFLDFSDVSSLRTPRDPDFPIEIAAVARTASGVAMGGARHQFRNEGTGFRARLMAEFPWVMLPQLVNGHCWHLASEFGNWIEGYLSSINSSDGKLKLVTR